MGSALMGVGTGSIITKPIGSQIGGIAGSIAEGAGATNGFQGQSAYNLTPGEAQALLQEQINRNSAIYGNQQNLAEALQAQMQGQGPNPSQIQYMNNVGNNIANAQGLIASQRGLNPALAARLGSNIASNENQKASFGSALLQQQQQLAAQNQLQNLYGQMSQGDLAQQSLLTGQANSAQNINAGVAQGNAQIRGQVAGGLLNAIGGAGAAAAKGGAAHGGKIQGKANVPGDSPSNDTVPTMLSPGEIVIPRSHAQDPEKAKEFIDHLLKSEKKSDVSYADVLKAKRKKK